MEQSNDVQQNSSPAASESANTQTQLPTAPVVTDTPATPPVGSKTPEANLYAALAEERRLRKEAEDKINQIMNTTNLSEPEFISDEAKLLKGHIDTLNTELNQIKEDKALDALCTQYPTLKETLDEFKEYRRAEHPRAKIESVAKLFLAEKGLLEGRRVGLENPTGGDRQPVKSGMTADDVKILRTTNPKKYKEMLLRGDIKIEA